jgi:hypothetical protein
MPDIRAGGRGAVGAIARSKTTNKPFVRFQKSNMGAFGSPTFFVGKELFFGKDQLRDVEEPIVEQNGLMDRIAATSFSRRKI